MRSTLVLVLAALLISGCASGGDGQDAVTGFHQNGPDDGMHGIVLPRPYRLPDVELTDTDGTSVDVRGMATKPLTLFFFGYTHCPDICPTTMLDIALAIKRLPKADQGKVAMVMVSTDPSRDDPKTLGEYVRRFDPHFRGATGEMAAVVQVGTALGVPIEKGDKLPSGGYDVAHGTQIVAARPDGTAPLVWTEGTSPQDLSEDLAKALREGIPKVGSNS